MRVSLPFVVLFVFLAAGIAGQAQAQTVSGFEHTSFNLSFDLSSVQQIGDDSHDLTFQDVTFGIEVPLTDRVGIWLTVSKAADFNSSATARKLRGSYGGGLSYTLARRQRLTAALQGGVLSRLERFGDSDLNPTAARISVKLGYRLLGEPSDSRWFGLYVLGGSDLALRDIMSASDGDIVAGDTTYHSRAGLQFSF